MINKNRKQVPFLFLILGLICFIHCNKLENLRGIVTYDKTDMICTKIECACCNDCESPLLFVTNIDTIDLYTHEKDTCIICGMTKCDTTIRLNKKRLLCCNGKDCASLHCWRFFANKKYELNGYYIGKVNNNKRKSFYVINFIQL